MQSSRSYSKNKVPYQMTPVERYSTIRAKIDLLNYIKRPINYIRGQSLLSDKSNGQTILSKLACFGGLICRYTKWTGHEQDKMEICVLVNFSKTAEKNKTPFIGIQVRLTLSPNQKIYQQSVHCTRRYSNIKVPYQMTKMDKYGSRFAKIHNLNYVILHTNKFMGKLFSNWGF